MPHHPTARLPHRQVSEELQPSAVGKRLNELIIQKVIITVGVITLLSPILSMEEVIVSAEVKPLARAVCSPCATRVLPVCYPCASRARAASAFTYARAIGHSSHSSSSDSALWPHAQVLGLELLVLGKSVGNMSGALANYSAGMAASVMEEMTRYYSQRIQNNSWNRLVFLDLEGEITAEIAPPRIGPAPPHRGPRVGPPLQASCTGLYPPPIT